jgi:anti-sigma B factor antagonist
MFMNSTVLRSQVIAFSAVGIAPTGEINAANAEEFKTQLITTVKSNSERTLVVDLENVKFLDSAGLIALVTAQRVAQDLNQRLVLCSVAPSIMILFELTQLDKAFEFFPNRNAVYTAV